jgi:S-adenosyl-L-methionine hydrolase (adenosine-forming)
MKGVMLGICPGAQLIDISHEIAPYAITEGAFTLAQAWSCFPPGSVHMVVVDPGVGSARRPIAVEAAGHYFVAPDNGVLTMLYEVVPVHEVREITAIRFFRQPVSRTFHGRDIFSPIAAHLAAGVAFTELGETITDYVRLGFAKPARTGEKTWSGTILKVDRFGNLVTNLDSASWQHLGEHKFELRIGWHAVTGVAQSYAGMGAGEIFVIAGSSGLLEVSANQASAAQMLKARAGDTIELHIF